MYNNMICVNKFYLISLTYANNSIPSSLIPPFLLIRFFVNILKAFNEQKNGCSRKLEIIKTMNSLFYLTNLKEVHWWSNHCLLIWCLIWRWTWGLFVGEWKIPRVTLITFPSLHFYWCFAYLNIPILNFDEKTFCRKFIVFKIWNDYEYVDGFVKRSYEKYMF